MTARRRSNALISIRVNGAQVEGVDGVCGAIFDHFQNHFKLVVVSQLSIDELSFKSISLEDWVVLTLPFSEEEIKQTIWNCDSYKSSGPDCINLGFIKEFWELLKDGLKRFFDGFHRYGKLT